MCSMSREVVHADEAPAPVGPYSHAVRLSGGSLIMLSGQTPIDPESGALVGADVPAQARQVFANLVAVLEAAGLTLENLVKVNVYLTSMADFDAMNAVYAELLNEPYPARTTVAVAGLPLGARIEVEAVASAP